MFKLDLLKIAFLFLISFFGGASANALEIAELKRAIVQLYSHNFNTQKDFAATGFFIKDKYQKHKVVTAAHFCIDAFENNVEFETSDGRKLTVDKLNIQYDLCIMNISHTYNLDVFVNIITNYNKMRNKPNIFIWGFPSDSTNITKANGKILELGSWVDTACSLKTAQNLKQEKYCNTNLDKLNCKLNLIAVETSAKVTGGFSGSPVFDSEFNVVGVVIAKVITNNNSYIMPSLLILKLLDEPELKL